MVLTQELGKQEKYSELVYDRASKRFLRTNKPPIHETFWNNFCFFINPFKLYRKILLPKNYETSVKNGYRGYVWWSIITSIFLSTTTIIGFEALFFSVLISNQDNFLEAAANWIVKDGLGQFGAMIVASFINTKYDAQPRQWRFMAGFLLDVATLIDIMTLFRPDLFLLIASVGNILKNIAWVSTSASRAAIHQSFSLTDNLADITARAASQSIFGSIIGFAGGVFTVPLLARVSDIESPLKDAPFLILGFVAILHFYHLLFLYRSLSYVAIDSLDLNRLVLATVDNSSIAQQSETSSDASNSVSENVLGPIAVSLKVPIINFSILFLRNRSIKSINKGISIEVGCSFKRLYNFKHENLVLSFMEESQDPYHVVWFDRGLKLLIRQNATDDKVLEGTLVVLLLAYDEFNSRSASQYLDVTEYNRLLDNTKESALKLKETLRRVGWETNQHFLETLRYRIECSR